MGNFMEHLPTQVGLDAAKQLMEEFEQGEDKINQNSNFKSNCQLKINNSQSKNDTHDTINKCQMKNQCPISTLIAWLWSFST